MNKNIYSRIISFLNKTTGILLTIDKGYFIEARLSPLLREENIPSLADLISRIEKGDKRIAQKTIDALTTNETFFFRDKTPFDNFRQIIIPELLAKRPAGETIRIWCAACSSGQEPFSLAMILDEMKPQLGRRNIEIHASDISEEILEKAKSGIFTQFEVQRGLPTKLLLRYFEKIGDNWKISQDILNRINFFKFNLLESGRRLDTFDVIFCRNVLIYFERPTRSKILANMADKLEPDGFLLLGGAESIFGTTDRFAPHPKERTINIPVSTKELAKIQRSAIV